MYPSLHCAPPGEWEDWGACDAQCGWGQHFRVRALDVTPAYGGQPAEGPGTEYQDCQDVPCPVDCEVRRPRRGGTALPQRASDTCWRCLG